MTASLLETQEFSINAFPPDEAAQSHTLKRLISSIDKMWQIDEYHLFNPFRSIPGFWHFTRTNARRVYSPRGDVLNRKGLREMNAPYAIACCLGDMIAELVEVGEM